MIKSYRCILSILLILSFSAVFSQSVKSLRNNKKKIEQDIIYLNKLLKSSSKDKSVTLSKLELVDRQIDNRKRLIKNIEQEASALSENVNLNKEKLTKSSQKLDILKKQYSFIVYNSWLHKSNNNKLIFILSSNDFNQAYLRLKYLKQYSLYTENLVKNINKLKLNLDKATINLIDQYKEKQLLATSLNDEKLSLAQEKEKYREYLASLSSQQKNLKKRLKKQLSAQSKLTSKIKKIIKIESKRKKKKTKVEIDLSSSFAKLKSKLPWPTRSGFISSRFGVHQHPVARKTKVRNDGIDITTGKNAKCYSVFEGRVSEIFNSFGLNNIVMIRHGKYLTVYANLSKVYVTKGERVRAGKAIGMIYTDENDNKTVLKFQVWKNTLKQNPSRWLLKYNRSSN